MLASLKAPLKAVGLLLAIAGLAGAGWWSAVHNGWEGIEQTLGFFLSSGFLLCLGLFMAATGIDQDEARDNRRIAILAITVGVLLKYVIIAGSTVLITQDLRFIILGMATAQIDPLSVAAMGDKKGMTERTKTVLRIWASFDDPVTVVLTSLILLFRLNLTEQAGHGIAGSLVADLAPYVVLVAVSLWFVHRRAMLNPERKQGKKGLLVLVALSALVPTRWHSLAAVLGWGIRIGWFDKPLWENAPRGLGWIGRVSRGQWITNLALAGASLMLGFLLAGGGDVKGGLALGLATYVSQIVVAWLLVKAVNRMEPGRPFSRSEIRHLMFGQQNGITAIILAVGLTVAGVSGAAATIAMAIVVVNVTSLIVNAINDAASREEENTLAA